MRNFRHCIRYESQQEKMLLKHVNPFALFLRKTLCPTIRANIDFVALKTVILM